MSKGERTQFRKIAWKWFSLYRRTVSALETMNSIEFGRCITCGRIIPVAGNDAGHFIAGRNDAILFEEHACHLQCVECNQMRGGEPEKYREALIDKYGIEEVERLEGLRHSLRKYSAEELRDIADIYRKKYQKLKEERVCLI